MHKFALKLVSAQLLASIAFTASADAHTHDGMCGHDNFTSPIAQKINEARLQAALSKKAAPYADAAVRVASAKDDPQNVVDVMVYVHPTYIADLSTAIRFDENGKPIENGAQFMHSLMQQQFDKVNEAFTINKVNAFYRIAYIHVLDSELPELGNTDAVYDEMSNLLVCASGHVNAADYEQCQTPVFEFANALVQQSGADTFHFVRSYQNDSPVVGLGSYFGGSAFYDTYASDMYNLVNSDTDQINIDNYLAGYSKVTVHEVGHVNGANHLNEDYDNKGHQAHHCGEIAAGTGIKKRTVMGRGEVHLFYSDPAIIIDGEACGITGVADNSDAVRTYAPILAAASDKPVVSTSFEFAQNNVTVDSGSGKHTVRLQRLGDLSKPASVAIIAVDGSAWEQRDFSFGWQEVTFAAGQAYGDVEFTVLERTEKHDDTEFGIKMMYSTIGTVQSNAIQVAVQSTNKPVIGTLTLSPATYTVAENAGSVVISINRLNGTDGEAKVRVTTRNQTAFAGTDFTAVDNEITFADGQQSATVAVNITNNSTYQGSRSFAVDIAPVTEGLTTENATATVTITDDETPPSTGGSSGGGSGGNADSGEESGGSFSFFALMFAALLLVRRRLVAN